MAADIIDTPPSSESPPDEVNIGPARIQLIVRPAASATPRQLVRHLAAAAGSPNPERLTLGHAASGQPMLIGCSLANAHVSLSHSRKQTAAVLSLGAPVGVDLADDDEFPDSYPVGRAFHATETALASPCIPHAPSFRSFLWACKEAAAKACGTGFQGLDFLAIRVVTLTIDLHAYRGAAKSPMGLLPFWVWRMDRGWLAIAVQPSA